MAIDQNIRGTSPSVNVALQSRATETAELDSSETRLLSFSEIFRAELRFLWRTLRSLGVPDADTDDLCQEVMLVVHRRLGEFDGQSVRGWLYGICVRVASDYRRSAGVRRRAREPLSERSVASAVESDVEGRKLEMKLMAVLDELDDEKRAVFVLYELEELTLREIAEALSIPLQTAYSRLRVARQHVRDTFAQAASPAVRGAER
jgi:RNA polymerase sigma-70 factor (ECF subfamily)